MKNVMRSVFGKTSVFLLLMTSILVLVLCVTGAVYMASENLYDTDYESHMNDIYRWSVASYPWEHILLDGEGNMDLSMAAELTDDKGNVIVSAGNIQEYQENYLACGLLAANPVKNDFNQTADESVETETHESAASDLQVNVYQVEGVGNFVVGGVYGENTTAMNRLCLGMPAEKRYLKFVFPVKPVKQKGILTDMYLRTFETFDEDYNNRLTVYVGPAFFMRQGYTETELFMKMVFAMKFWVYPVGVVAGLLSVLLFVALMSLAGHRPDREDIVPGVFIRVPLEILLGLAGLMLIAMVAMLDEVGGILIIILAILFLIWTIYMILGLCMTIAVRLKLHVFWKNTICYRLWELCKRSGKVLQSLCKKAGQAAGHFFKGIPLIWKTVLALTVLCLAELICILLCWWETDILAILWFLERLVLVPLILLIVMQLKRLEKGAAELARGDLNRQLDTHRMFGVFRQHGENLNQISRGMQQAVEERLKSERMKAELITNVSHDIKTPLTSIINYAGLIEQEPCENAKITEYTQVLTRQSVKLKRLLEDLVEASKASTGNLEIETERCDAGMFIGQAAGEYQEKMAAAELTLVTKSPEAPIFIMADSRRMWRIFDNLMSNICKYSQPGTRVYLTLEKSVGINEKTENVFSKVINMRSEAAPVQMATITFRNTSREELNISAEELMERFVRGDSARNTEGNGLGLSIARSLTELQGGTFSLDVDGDLFKVTLRFPMCS